LTSPELLLPLIALPWAVGLVNRVYRADGAALNPLLGKTAQLELAYGALLALGLIV
jgi:1,4-dihydroxy-2-naphthoate octaprenyltransferase